MDQMGDIDKKKNKALAILKEHLTRSALQWLIKQEHPNAFYTLDVTCPKGKKDNRKIYKSTCFTYENDTYELYYVDETFLSNEYVNADYCTFILYFNNELVLEIMCSEKDVTDHFQIDNQLVINWSAINLKFVKLSEWVESIPKIVALEWKERSRQVKIQKKKDDEKIAKDIENNINLGNYE
jgi:hypothetical protein